jgi:hypothetical protein
MAASPPRVRGIAVPVPCGYTFSYERVVLPNEPMKVHYTVVSLPPVTPQTPSGGHPSASCRENRKRTDMTEPVALLDKDLAAKTIEPLVARIFEQLEADLGFHALQRLLPIDVGVTITLRSGEQIITAASMTSQVAQLDVVS